MSYSRSQLRAVILIAYVACPAAILAYGLTLFNTALVGRLLYAFAEVNFFLLLYSIGHWEFIGFSFRKLSLGASVVVAVLLGMAGGGSQTSTVQFVGFGVVGIALTTLRWQVYLAGRIPDHGLDLMFPLRNGRYVSTDGGDGKRSALINYHYRASIHQGATTNRSMAYAVDIVKLGPRGLSARGWVPSTLSAYHIYDEPVHAPLEGAIVAVVDGIPNNEPFVGPYPYSVGNHVVIQSGPIYVILGHLNSGSLRVKIGDVVRAGDLLGRIGNSGLTERPHLHLQACAGPDGDYWKGEGVPVMFDGVVPAKGQMFDRK